MKGIEHSLKNPSSGPKQHSKNGRIRIESPPTHPPTAPMNLGDDDDYDDDDGDGGDDVNDYDGNDIDIASLFSGQQLTNGQRLGEFCLLRRRRLLGVGLRNGKPDLSWA